jgi:hypothetical protein
MPDELHGGTFTISNGGIYGSLLSTPIINPPQSGILGMQRHPGAASGARRERGDSADDVRGPGLRSSSRGRAGGCQFPQSASKM